MSERLNTPYSPGHTKPIAIPCRISSDTMTTPSFNTINLLQSSAFGLSTGSAKLAFAHSLLRQAGMLANSRLAHPGVDDLRVMLIQLQEAHAVLLQRITGWHFISSLWYSNDADVVQHVEDCLNLRALASLHANLIQEVRAQESGRVLNSNVPGSTPKATSPFDYGVRSPVVHISGLATVGSLNVQWGNEVYGPTSQTVHKESSQEQHERPQEATEASGAHQTRMAAAWPYGRDHRAYI
ncbi:hypothetical protein CONPUDRAFT_163772 [Coniophora puteana RWD-64-598 SS2]|uniref:Uncharacterized protein n=1 Tax=Coniophora puteana (strain RWD-64-598) TaxID=741705 RepID=A0A5M3MU39_CONPW|nr:uncharacterized protein CONPUDRAFT_163772 [Coniophora puteana RWD-64-598 SS2]EIW82678.1 hypothetical protein CONPUDRAFT_163772 [Coniophora puteana RWD-64-598 SS2]